MHSLGFKGAHLARGSHVAVQNNYKIIVLNSSEDPNMIVDAHTHLGSFPTFNVKLDAEGLVDIMKECGVEHSVLFSHPNKLTHEAILSYPERFKGLVWVNPKDGEKALREVEIGVKKHGFKGVKMHPLMDSFLPDDPVVHPVIELAIKLSPDTLPLWPPTVELTLALRKPRRHLPGREDHSRPHGAWSHSVHKWEPRHRKET
jgi:hypothetical protein